MSEITPPTPEEMRWLERSLMEKVLDIAAGDPWWEQRLLADPEVTMLEAGFPEAERLREMYERADGRTGGCRPGVSFKLQRMLCGILERGNWIVTR
jgi:hypothetical protein